MFQNVSLFVLNPGKCNFYTEPYTYRIINPFCYEDSVTA